MDFNVHKPPAGVENSFGKNLFILGTSIDGPSLEPVLVKNIDHAQRVFGPNYMGTLLKAYNEAYQVAGDNINIYLVRVSGSNSEIELYTMTPEAPQISMSLKLTSTNAGEIYNTMKVYIYSDSIELVNPSQLGGDNFIFRYSDYPTVGLLSAEINNLARQGLVYAWSTATNSHTPTEYLANYYQIMDMLTVPMYLRYGNDGINISKNELHDSLEIAYNILEGQPIDIICIADAYFDDVSPAAYFGDNQGYAAAYYTANRDYLTKQHLSDPERTATFHGQLIRFCYRQMNSAIVTHGVMAFNPVENLEDIFEDDSYINKVVFASCFQDRFDLITRKGQDIVDHGRFLSVTMGEFEYESYDNIPYYNNGYIGYAALLAMNLTPNSTTNMVVPNINDIRYHLPEEEINSLSTLGVVTFRYSIMKDAIVVCNGVTAETSTSPYHNVSNARMVQMTVSYLRNLMEDYIGQNAQQLVITQAMHKAIDELIDELKAIGIIQDVQYTLNINPLTGIAVLNLDILPIYSIEYVNAVSQTKL